MMRRVARTLEWAAMAFWGWILIRLTYEAIVHPRVVHFLVR